MESAQTGQVGKSLPRGSGLCAAVDRTSAVADIDTSLLALPAFPVSPITYTSSLDEIATQMRWFLVLKIHEKFCDAASFSSFGDFDLHRSVRCF
jgi:hypothetical protein